MSATERPTEADNLRQMLRFTWTVPSATGCAPRRPRPSWRP